MRTKYTKFAMLLCLILYFILPIGEEGSVMAATLKLNSSSFTLEVNHYKTLYVSGTSKKVTWSTSNSKVATVSTYGRVTAKAPGTVTINATVAGKKLSSKVTVIKISTSSSTLIAGETKSLKVYGATAKVTWSSSNKAVATVSSKGKVTAKTTGTATIYAYTSGKKISSKVTVLKLSATSSTLSSGASKTLKVYGTRTKVTWSSSNKAVATVSSTGKVTAKASGTATIYASSTGRKLSSKVTVVKLNSTAATLSTGTVKTLKVYGTTNTITWTSTNKDVATVSSSGKVTAMGPGSAKIYAAVSGVKLASNITVKHPIMTNTTTPTPEVTPSGEASTPVSIEEPAMKIVGYYAAWARYSGYTPEMIDARKLTHINYAFANIGSDLRITLGYPDIDPSNISKLNQLKIINPNLKTIISVGGWSWSGRFSDVALTETSRAIFADSCVDFIVKYGFDGIDIDWEYPVSGGLSNNIRRPEDKYNFTLLFKTLREKLDARGKKDGREYLLTFAGAAGSWYTKNIELAKISQYVDFANIMTYDIHGTWEPYTNFNAPLYSNDPLQPYKISVSSSVQDWLKAGFTKEKLILGVPFYGFIYKAVANINNGLYQTYSGGASISYANIAKNYLNAPGYIRYYHNDSRVPWLFNGSTFITYDDEQSMIEKAKYIKETGLSGVMIWELSQDPNKVLLNSLYQEISK